MFNTISEFVRELHKLNVSARIAYDPAETQSWEGWVYTWEAPELLVLPPDTRFEDGTLFFGIRCGQRDGQPIYGSASVEVLSIEAKPDTAYCAGEKRVA